MAAEENNVVRYSVHLTDTATVMIDAAKVNKGLNWLWFFDNEDNLIGLFYWKNIFGFSVEGPATGQIITDRLPFEMGRIRPEELSAATHDWLREIQGRQKSMNQEKLRTEPK